MTVRDVLDFQELMFCACVRNAMRPSRRSPAALSLSTPAQASLTLRPAGSLSRPEATFVRAHRQLLTHALQ
jgi:hypothetical protein